MQTVKIELQKKLKSNGFFYLLFKKVELWVNTM